MITEIDLSQWYIKKEEIRSAFQAEANADAATVIKNAINAKPNLGTSHNDAARGDHNHDGTYLKSYTPPTASTENAGIVQLNESTNSSVKNQAATPSAVQAVYNLVQEKDVTVEKLNANNTTSGYLATYEIRQGNVLLGKIDIPKDFLIKSGTVKKCEVANTPPGFAKGDKYLELQINVTDESEDDSFIFVDLKDLVDLYYADEETLHLSDENIFSIKENGIQSSHIANNAIENRHISSNTKIDFSKLNISKENISSLNPPFSSNTHAHGSLDINGVIDDDIQGVYRVVVTNNNKQIKTANKIPSENLILPDAGENVKGIVQLKNSIDDPSIDKAATAGALQQLNNKFGGNGTAKNAHTHTKSQITDLYKIIITPEKYNVSVIDHPSENSSMPISMAEDAVSIYVSVKVLNTSNNPVPNHSIYLSCDKGYFKDNGQQIKTILLQTNNNGNATAFWVPTEWGLCTFSALNETTQVLATGFKTYTVNNYYTIYYDDKMCHMEFKHDYGTTKFNPILDWTDFGEHVRIPDSPNLRPEHLINIPTSRKNFYILIRPNGYLAWKNIASSAIQDLGEAGFSVSWKKQ